MSRQVAYLGNDTLLTTTKLGRKIYVDGRDLSVAPHLLMEGDWERWITSFMQRQIMQRKDDPQGTLLIDVGANFGWYSLIMWFTKEAKYDLLAIEPNPRLCELLAMTLNVNGIPARSLVRKAAGPELAYANLHFDPTCVGGGFTSDEPAPVAPAHLPDHLKQRTVPVEVVPLDALVDDGKRVAMIKIDVEGNEPGVIAGAKRIIAENPFIELLIEHHHTPAHRRMLDELLDDGFGLFWVGYDSALKPIPLDEVDEKVPVADMVYLRR